MVKHVIAQTIFKQHIIGQILPVCYPVVADFFGTQNQHRFVAQLIVFDNAQGAEGLAKTDAVSQDAAIVFFQFANAAHDCIFLKVIQPFPYLRLLETGRVVRQDIFRQVFQELTENVVEDEKVDCLRRVFFIDRTDVFHDLVCDVLQFCLVVPYLIE